MAPIGARVELRVGRKLVKIYHRGALIKVHPRQGKGKRVTDPDDLRPWERDYVSRDPEPLRRQAAELSPEVGFYADALLGSHPTLAKLRSVRYLNRLGERFGAAALAKACRQAMAVELYDVDRLRAILLRAIEQAAGPEPGPEPEPPPGRFARPGDEFIPSALIADDRDHYRRDH